MQGSELDILSAARAVLEAEAPGGKFLLAVSGGADSVAMLDMVARLAPDMDFRLIVGHVDHGLRPESHADAEFVASLSRRLGLPFVGHRVDVLALARAEKLSQEAAARKARYRALEEMAQAWQCHRILTAHTADDSGETFLMRFVQSPNWWECTSIPKKRGKMLRPLLALRRQQVRSYALMRGLSWRDDISNENERFMRNYLRLSILPRFDKQGAEVDVPALAKAGEEIREVVEHILKEADKFVEEQRDRHEKMVLAIPDILSYFGLMCWAPAERAAASLIGDPNFRWPAWCRRQVADFIAARHSKGMLHLEMGIHLLRHGSALAVVSQIPETVCHSLQGCRRHGLDGLGEISLSIGANGGTLNKGNRIYVRPDLADRTLQLRTWRPGDRLRIFRRGHRKISDLLNELHVDPVARQGALVLCDDEGPFWLVGQWSDQRVAPSPEDKFVLEVEWRTT